MEKGKRQSLSAPYLPGWGLLEHFMVCIAKTRFQKSPQIPRAGKGVGQLVCFLLL